MISLNTLMNWGPDLEGAIDRQPLRVDPDTLLVDLLDLIRQAPRQTLQHADPAHLAGKIVQTSCVLVMQDQKLLGIFTERDIVKLTAQSANFATTKVAEVMTHPVITLPQNSIHDIFAALFLFRRYRIRHLPIVDDDQQLIGVISHESIRQVLRPANLLRFRRVADIMATNVVQAPLTATVMQLAQLMAALRVSCVVITQADEQENNQPIGIVTERDIVQFQTLKLDLLNTLAQTVMSTPLFLLRPEDSLWTAYQEMQKRQIGRLVVSWNWGQGLGIVTQSSLLKVFDPMEMYGVIENLQQTIEQLEAEQNTSSTNPTPASSELLITLLDSARQDTQHLISEPILSIPQRTLLLQSILYKLGQLDRHIRL